MESRTPYKREELERWTVRAFNQNLLYFAWKNYYENKQHEQATGKDARKISSK